MVIGDSPKRFHLVSLVLLLLCQLVSSQQSNSLTVDDNYVYGTTRPDGIQYSHNWSFSSGSASPFSSISTLHYTTVPESYLVYFFQGDAIYYYGERDIPHGLSGVSIDGARPDEVNSTGTSLQYQQLLWSKTGLGPGDHQIIIGHGGQPGQYITLDHLRIESDHGFTPEKSGPAASIVSKQAIIIDDTDPSVSYSSNWTIVEAGAYYKNSLHYTRNPGSTATFKFNGTAVWYFADTDAPHGNVRINLDGGPGNTTSGYSSVQLTQRLIWSQEGLEDKEHTVVISQADSDGQYTTLDYFMYLPSDSSSNPDPPKKDAPVAAIAGGATGGALLVIVAGVLLFLFFRRRKREIRTSRNIDFFGDTQAARQAQLGNPENQPLFQVAPFTHPTNPERPYQPHQPANVPITNYFEHSHITSNRTTPQRQEKMGRGYLPPSNPPPGSSTATYTSTSGSSASSYGAHHEAPPAYM